VSSPKRNLPVALEIVRGASGRRKVVEVRGMSEADVVARLAAASGVWRF
jgi:hypothetical protein